MCPRARSARRTDRYPGGTRAGALCEPTPLSRRQIKALLAAVARELIWGLRTAGRELDRWCSRARQIPDPTIRKNALDALNRKRGNTHGAALFWTLPRARSPHLLRLLVTYQVMWDYLDCASEQGAGAGQHNGRQLHLALVDALDPQRSIADYYRHHPWHEDGGYLRALVGACRSYSAELPTLQLARPVLLREAIRANVQAINHEQNATLREMALRDWVTEEFAAWDEVEWFELASAAGAGLAIYALLSLAADTGCDEKAITRVHHAYFPWVGALATMLDSYVDEAEDRANDDHCYVAYYPSQGYATWRIGQLIRRCMCEAQVLENHERHTLLIACMVAMYLSKDSARTHVTRARTRSLVRAGGTLTRLLLPVLRVWRIAYGQRAT